VKFACILAAKDGTGCRTPDWPDGCNPINCGGTHSPSGTCCQSCEPDDHCGCCALIDIDQAR